MSRKVNSLVLGGALMLIASPAVAEKILDTQVGKFDLDPFNILAPAAPSEPAAATPAPAPKTHHKHHKKM